MVTVKEVPFKCPVCAGTGENPHADKGTPCKACVNGIVWGKETITEEPKAQPGPEKPAINKLPGVFDYEKFLEDMRRAQEDQEKLTKPYIPWIPTPAPWRVVPVAPPSPYIGDPPYDQYPVIYCNTSWVPNFGF